MRLSRVAGAIAAVALSFGLVNAASATTFLFTETEANLGPGPYGTVDVEEDGLGGLTFVVNLAAGLNFHTSPNNHDAFAFNLIGNPDVTYSDMTAGFFPTVPGAGEPPFQQSPFGDFWYAVTCNCQTGTGLAGPLAFTVTPVSGVLTLASLGAVSWNELDILFSADVVQQGTGFTGNIGATTTAIPEPATWAMMIIGFGMVGFGLRRRRRLQHSYA